MRSNAEVGSKENADALKKKKHHISSDTLANFAASYPEQDQTKIPSHVRLHLCPQIKLWIPGKDKP